jgi:hypothetical protein
MADFGFYDFSLGTNLLATPLSMNDNTRSLEWAFSENVELYGQNGVRKMQGNYAYLDLGEDTKILAISEYKKNRDKLLVFVYADDTEAHFCVADGVTSTYTVVKSGLDKDAFYHIAKYNNGCVVSNGVANSFLYLHEEKPEIITCRTFEAYGIYPKATLLFRGRLYAFTETNVGVDALLNNSGSLFYSVVDNPALWDVASGGGYFSQIAGTDLPIRALCDYGEQLAIHRDGQTVLLKGSTELDFEITPFSDKGAMSPRGVLNYDNKQLFYDNGIYALQYSSLNQVQLSSELSRNITPAFVGMNSSNFKNMIAVSYPLKKQIWFFMSESTDETEELDTVWVMDRKNPKNVVWYKRKATPVICACCFNDKIYTGTADGKILREDYTTTLDGALFSGTWKSAWLKFGSLKLKSVETGLDIGFDGDASNNVTLELRFNTDNSRVKRRAITTPQRSKGVWGVSKWSTSTVKTKFRRTVSSIRRVNIPGIFKSVQVCITSTNDFIFNSLAFYDVVIEE